MPATISTETPAAEILARLIDQLLGELPEEEEADWRQRVERVVSKGADLSGVVPRFMHVLLTDPEHGAVRYAVGYPEVERAVEAVVRLYRRALSGEHPTAAEWAEAARAAQSAAWAAAWAEMSARAAQSASWAAQAAEASAWTAREAEESAEEAARAAAWAAWAKAEPARAKAARVDHYRWQAGVLYSLLSETPGGTMT